MDVHLLSGRPIYFPFLSGILDYQCSTCDARCCKGGGLGIGRSRELAGLLHISPALALFAQDGFPNGALPILDTVLEKCWFLDSKSLCRLERAVGREQKPAACRLFPFHQMRVAGEWVVVMPHFFCPLTVTEGPGVSERSNHDELAMEIHAVGVPRDGHPAMPDPPGVSWAHAVPLERRVRELGRAFLDVADYAPYADAQLELTTEMLGTPRSARSDTLRARVATFLGYGDGKPGARVVHDLVALTPYLRMRLAAVPREGLPGLLTSLSVVAAAVEDMPGTQLSARTLVQLLEKRAPMLHALAHLMETPFMAEGYTAESLARGARGASPLFQELLTAVEHNRRARRPATLGNLLAALPAFRPPLSPEACGTLMTLGRYVTDAFEFQA
ncbi:MAG: hypothetical protein AB2A00_39395 [Myxococcota bacterium]